MSARTACPASAPVRQIQGFEERRSSGSSYRSRSGDEPEIRTRQIVVRADRARHSPGDAQITAPTRDAVDAAYAAAMANGAYDEGAPFRLPADLKYRKFCLRHSTLCL